MKPEYQSAAESLYKSYQAVIYGLDLTTPEGIAAEKQARTLFEERIAFITREARLYGAAPPVVPPYPPIPG